MKSNKSLNPIYQYLLYVGIVGGQVTGYQDLSLAPLWTSGGSAGGTEVAVPATQTAFLSIHWMWRMGPLCAGENSL